MKRFGFTVAACILLLAISAPLLAANKVRSLCDIRYPSDDRIEWQCRKLKWTDSPRSLFGGHWEDVLRFNRMDRRHFYGGRSIKVPVRIGDVARFSPLPEFYPEAAGDAKFILVDQSESFLGAYAYGRLVYSFPVALGIEGHRVPNGEFRIDALDRRHRSNLYTIRELGRRYPMHYAMRFHVDKSTDGWPSYWLHGRDLPGHPASHGCIGLYDEAMQKEYYDAYDRKVNRQHYRQLTEPFLDDAKRLYQWVVGSRPDSGRFHRIDYGPRVLIIGTPPI